MVKRAAGGGEAGTAAKRQRPATGDKGAGAKDAGAKAAGAKASRVPKSYQKGSTGCRQTKTPIYLTEQLLYTEEQTTAK